MVEKKIINQLPSDLSRKKENSLMCLLFFPTVNIAYVLFLEYTKGDAAGNKSQLADLFLAAVCIVSTDNCKNSCGSC